MHPGAGDPLELLLLCCHPALSRASQVALTPRAVSGLSTAEVATAFLVPEATMADDPALRRHHRLFAVRTHLRELAGDDRGALDDYRQAARLTASQPEQRYLNARAGRLAGPGGCRVRRCPRPWAAGGCGRRRRRG